MGDANLVLAGQLRELLEDFLNLLREYIDALDFHHVISTPGNHIDARVLAATLAIPRNNPGHIVGTVADQRRPFLHQGGDDNLAPLPVSHRLQGNRVDDFQINIIIPVMHAVVIFAADADARAINLRQAVNVVQLNAQLAGNTVTHLLPPALGADDALFQINIITDAAFLDFLCQQQGVG